MSRFANKFDILRGWPREGALDESFYATVVSGVPVGLPSGTLVSLQPDGSVNKAQAGDRSVWVVLEGNDDYSGTFTGKCVCLRSNCEVRLDPSNFVAGTYAPATALTLANGQFTSAGATATNAIGEVIRDDRNIDGTLVVLYTGNV